MSLQTSVKLCGRMKRRVHLQKQRNTILKMNKPTPVWLILPWVHNKKMEISVFAKEPIKCMHWAIFWGDFKLLFRQTDLTSVFLWVAFWTALCIQNILCYSTVHLRAAFIDFTLLLNSSPIYNPPIKTEGHIPSTLPEVRGCYSGGGPKERRAGLHPHHNHGSRTCSMQLCTPLYLNLDQ